MVNAFTLITNLYIFFDLWTVDWVGRNSIPSSSIQTEEFKNIYPLRIINGIKL